MEKADWHTFQILTKRARRLTYLAPKLPWPQNVWQGVSVEREDYLWRIDELRKVKASVRSLSLEPLLGPLDGVNLNGISWVVVGGESGSGNRPMKVDWVRTLRDICVEKKVAFFFKQFGDLKNNPDKLADLNIRTHPSNTSSIFFSISATFVQSWKAPQSGRFSSWYYFATS